MKREKGSRFPIEKKLEAIEWNLELLRASVATTHTPLRTLKSMVEVDVMSPTLDLLSKALTPTLEKAKEKLSQIVTF